MKTRAVFIGTNAYPYLILYWYELFTRIWQDEVDRVYLAISQPEHMSVWPAVKNLLTSHPKIRVIETNTTWPNSINTAIHEVTEDLLFIAHDDTFVYEKGVLTEYFDIIEKNPLTVVTPLTAIYSAPELIHELLKKKYPNQVPFTVEETGEIGYSFYCNMFFIARELLERTSMDFGSYAVHVNEYSPLLDWTPRTNPLTSDTNFLLCLELLNVGAKFKAIKKYEMAHIYNEREPMETLIKLEEEKTGAFAPGAGWVHLQTMAYHIYGLYFDLGVREELERVRGGKVPPRIEELSEMRGVPSFYWSHTIRIAWIWEFMQWCNTSIIPRYHVHAQKELDHVIDYLGIRRRNLEICMRIYHNLLWGE